MAGYFVTQPDGSIKLVQGNSIQTIPPGHEDQLTAEGWTRLPPGIDPGIINYGGSAPMPPVGAVGPTGTSEPVDVGVEFPGVLNAPPPPPAAAEPPPVAPPPAPVSNAAQPKQSQKQQPTPTQPKKPQVGASIIPDEFKVSDDEYNRAQQRAAEINQRQLEAQKEYKADYANRMSSIDAMTKEIQDYKVDPDYFWSGRPTGKFVKKEESSLAKVPIIGPAFKNKPGEIEEVREGGLSTGQKIGLVLASALASYASGIGGRDPLAGIKMIDDMVERDLKKQQIELEKKKDIHQSKINLLGQMRNLYQDDQAALEAAKGFQFQQAKAMLDKMGFSADRADAAKNYSLALQKLAADKFNAAEDRKIDQQKMLLDFAKADAAKAADAGISKIPVESLNQLTTSFKRLNESVDLKQSYEDFLTSGESSTSAWAAFNTGRDTVGSRFLKQQMIVINRMLKDMGGTTISAQEFSRLRNEYVGWIDSPESGRAKIQEQIDYGKMNIENSLDILGDAGHNTDPFRQRLGKLTDIAQEENIDKIDTSKQK